MEVKTYIIFFFVLFKVSFFFRFLIWSKSCNGPVTHFWFLHLEKKWQPEIIGIKDKSLNINVRYNKVCTLNYFNIGIKPNLLKKSATSRFFLVRLVHTYFVAFFLFRCLEYEIEWGWGVGVRKIKCFKLITDGVYVQKFFNEKNESLTVNKEQI